MYDATPRISAQTKGGCRSHFEAVRKCLTDTAWIEQTASMLHEAQESGTSSLYKSKVRDLLRKIPKSADVHASNRASFMMQALVLNYSVAPHRDKGDYKDGPAITLPFGDYEGALVCLPELRHPSTGLPICFEQRPGDALSLRTAVVQHHVRPTKSGNRFCHVFATKHCMIEESTYEKNLQTCDFCDKELDAPLIRKHI